MFKASEPLLSVRDVSRWVFWRVRRGPVPLLAECSGTTGQEPQDAHPDGRHVTMEERRLGQALGTFPEREAGAPQGSECRR